MTKSHFLKSEEKVADVFDDLFLKGDELKKYELEKLYKQFVLEPEDLLKRLRVVAQDSELLAMRTKESYLLYKSYFLDESRLGNSNEASVATEDESRVAESANSTTSERRNTSDSASVHPNKKKVKR